MAQNVLPGFKIQQARLLQPPRARGDGTGHIACEIARLLRLLDHWETTSGPRPPGKAPSGAQNRISVEMAQGYGSEKIGLAFEYRVVRVCTQSSVPTPPFCVKPSTAYRVAFSGHGAPSRWNGGSD